MWRNNEVLTAISISARVQRFIMQVYFTAISSFGMISNKNYVLEYILCSCARLSLLTKYIHTQRLSGSNINRLSSVVLSTFCVDIPLFLFCAAFVRTRVLGVILLLPTQIKIKWIQQKNRDFSLLSSFFHQKHPQNKKNLSQININLRVTGLFAKKKVLCWVRFCWTICVVLSIFFTQWELLLCLLTCFHAENTACWYFSINTSSRVRSCRKNRRKEKKVTARDEI